MNIPVFVSYPKPYLQRQQDFLDFITQYLETRGIQALTLGVTEYDMKVPLVAVRRILSLSFGVIVVAFRRGEIRSGIANPKSNVGRASRDLSGTWTTSAYCHIEPAMAFQIGLPILILRESGVSEEGMLEKGAMGIYLPEFDLDKGLDFLHTEEWRQLIFQWESNVRSVFNSRGVPTKLF